jgi:hypothetical protein
LWDIRIKAPRLFWSNLEAMSSTDREVRIFKLGDVFLLEDTTGKGHKSRIVGAEDFVAAIVQLS